MYVLCCGHAGPVVVWWTCDSGEGMMASGGVVGVCLCDVYDILMRIVERLWQNRCGAASGH